MKRITAAEASRNLEEILDALAQSEEPIELIGGRNTCVLVSQDRWRAIQETLFLTAIPRMRKSILKGLKTPVDKCSKDPGWWLGDR